jgi:hypothetical protein
MVFFQVDYFKLFEVVVFFHVTTMATGMPPSGDLVLLLKFISPQSRSLESSLNGISDLSLFLREGGHFRLLFSDFVRVFAPAGLG